MSESSMTPPDWAVLYVRGAVRMGMTAPEIEQHLVSRGMSAEDAHRLVMDTIEQAHAANAEPIGSSEWGRPVRMLLGGSVAALCLVLAYCLNGAYSVGYCLMWVVPGLGAVWLPDLTDTQGSSWAARSFVFGWAVLVLCLCSRIYYLVLVSML